MEMDDIMFSLEGVVTFSPSERCLIGSNGFTAELTENNLRFLLLLLNGVTEKETIINQVWKEQRGAVSESSYYSQLYMLRKAFTRVGLKESLIRTIPRKGVKYVGNVSRLTLKEKKKATDIPINNYTTKKVAENPAPAIPAVMICGSPKQSNVHSSHNIMSVLTVLSTCWLFTLSILIALLFFK